MSTYPPYPIERLLPYRPRTAFSPPYAELSPPVKNAHLNDYEEIRKRINEVEDNLYNVEASMKQVRRCMEDMKRGMQQQCDTLEVLLRGLQEDMSVLSDGMKNGLRKAGR
jgi:hypothetical protein